MFVSRFRHELVDERLIVLLLRFVAPAPKVDRNVLGDGRIEIADISVVPAFAASGKASTRQNACQPKR